MEKKQIKGIEINQNIQSQYKTYLQQVTNRIVQICLQDDALNTLKTMQSKQYLIERIKQIVTQVYEIEKQNQIIKLLKQLQTCRSIIQENSQKQNERQNNYIQKQLTNESNEPQNYKILQNQNIQLQKNIILQEQEHKFHIRELNQTINFLTTQNQRLKNDSSEKLAGIIQNFKLLQQKYRNIYQQKTTIQQNLQYQIQKSVKQNIQLKDTKQQLCEFKEKNQKLVKKITQIEQRQTILNEKIMRLQQSQGRYQEQIKNYQNQIKLIKLIQQKKRQQESSGYDLNLEEQSKKIKQLEQEQIAYNLAQKDRRILQLQKLKQKLKCQKNNLQMQFHDHRMKCQKQKMQMQTTIKNLLLKNQKGARVSKQQNLKQKQKMLQQFNEKISNQRYQIENSLTQKIKELQNNFQKQKCKYQQTKKHLKAIELLLKQKQSMHNSTLNQYQQKNSNMKSYLKQLQNKIANKHLNYQEIEKQNSLKNDLHEQQLKFLQEQNARLKKQLQKIRQDTQRTNAKILFASSINKNEDSNQVLNKQFQNTIKQLKQNQILLQSELNYLKKQLKLRVDQVNQQKLLNQQIKEKLQKYQEKCKKIQKELFKQKKEIIQNETNHQRQIQQLCKKHQIVTAQMKRQITFHYEQLLKDQHRKIEQITNNDSKEQNKIIVKTLKDTIQDLRSNIQKYEQKIQALTIAKKQLIEEIKTQSQKMEDLQNSVKQNQNKLRLQKEKQRQIISFYESKLHLNKIKFKDFKYQFYVALKAALDQLKKQLYQITLSIGKMQNQFHNTLEKLSIQIFKEINIMKIKHCEQLKTQKQYYENQIILKLEIDKQEITYQNQKKNKQKNIQIMTILAERQYQLAHLTEKDKHNSKKINQVLQNLHLTQQDLEKIKKQNVSFKQILQKMNDKVCQLEKQKISLSHQLKSTTEQKLSLEKSMSQIQNMYMQKLQKCRQKYIKQNQKLFSKYEREFDKLIGMNSKNKQIGTGMSTISSILSPNLIPTKQCQKVGKDKKLESLAKQIEMQKKKLELLQETKLKKNKSKQKDSVVTNFKRTCQK